MPVSPTTLYVLRNLKAQLRRTYMLIPITMYLLLLFIYPVIEHDLFGHESVDCSEKTPLVKLDENVFSSIYRVVRRSENLALLCFLAVPYLLHFGSPVLYLLFLLYKRPGWFFFWWYALSLGLASAFSVLLQYSFPTAPPWLYTDLPAEAKFYRVDEVLPINIFHNIYGLNKLVCGAFPSVHVQWPTAMALTGMLHPLIGGGYVLWIMTAAVYSEHHWMSDVLAGLTIGVIAVVLSKLYCKKLKFEEIKYEGDAVVLVDENLKSATALQNEIAV